MWMLLATHTTKMGYRCRMICLALIQFMPFVTMSLLSAPLFTLKNASVWAKLYDLPSLKDISQAVHEAPE